MSQTEKGVMGVAHEWASILQPMLALIRSLPPAADTAREHTLPKTVCLLSSQGVGTVVMKNWLPLVFGPALAMLRVKGRSCLKLRSNSS